MKKKFVAITTLFLALGLVGCGGSEPKTKECETHTFELVNDGEKHHNKCSVCGFEEEAKDHSFKKNANKADVAATCASEGKTYKICACGAEKEETIAKLETHKFVESSNQSGLNGATCTSGGQVRQVCEVCKKEQVVDSGKGLGHEYVAGQTLKNGDGKDCLVSSCSRCKKTAKVEIAITDAVSGAENIESSGKIKKDTSIVWKINCPQAGNVTLQFYVKYGQSGTSLTDEVKETIWGKSGDGDKTYGVKVGDKDATVLVNGKSYQETGLQADESYAYIDFATFAVVAGDNTITLSVPNQYYRNAFSGNVVLVYSD